MIEQFENIFQSASLLYLTSEPKRGAGRARNVGLEHAVGKWLLFLDADDFFTSEAFGAFDKYKDSDNDIIFFNTKSVKLSTGEPCGRAKKNSDLVVNKELDMLRYRVAPPYCKMVRRSMVVEHKLQFEELRVSNDSKFSYMAGHYAQKVEADATIAYCVTEADKGGSLTKQKSNENQFLRYVVAVDRNVFLCSIGRKDLRAPLISYIGQAILNFGLCEGFRYFSYAFKKRQNIFCGRR